jgi:hypothetical protein|tara:strand:- start:726 stop:935 length:210 start_codon:yes stop_codon:yes gene_type:complete
MLIPFQSPLFFTAVSQQNRTRLDDFRLVISRFYIAIIPFGLASIVDKTRFINQSAAILAPFFYLSGGTP